MCTRVPSPPPSHPPQSLPPPFPLQSSAPPPFPPPPTLLPPVSPLPSPRAMPVYSPTARLAAAAASRSARLSAWLGSRLGSARLNRLGRHGLARLSTARHGSARLGTAGTAAAARMPAMPSWSALLGAAQLSSAQLGSSAQPRGSSGSARSARLARLRLTRFSARGGALLVAATCVRSTGQARRSRALAKIGPWAGRVRHCHSGTKGAGQGRVAYPTKSTLAERSRGVPRGENGRDGSNLHFHQKSGVTGVEVGNGTPTGPMPGPYDGYTCPHIRSTLKARVTKGVVSPTGNLGK